MTARYKTHLAFFPALLLLATPAQADTFACEAKVTVVSVAPFGLLQIGFQGIGTAYFCNVNSDMTTSVGIISAKTCEAWLSKVLTAKATGMKIQFIMDYGSDPTPANCSSIPNFNWNVPNPFPYWFALVD